MQDSTRFAGKAGSETVMTRTRTMGSEINIYAHEDQP